jgi:hypothetical protein
MLMHLTKRNLDRASAFPLAMQVGAVCLFVVLISWKPLDQYGAGDDIPDMWVGITAGRLRRYLGALGPNGRKAYLWMNFLDFLLVMPTYTISLGALLHRQCKLAGLSTNISLTFPFMMFCDVIETIVLRYATKIFPNPPNDVFLTVGSIANQVKYSTFVLGLVLLIVLHVRNYYHGLWSLQNKSK